MNNNVSYRAYTVSGTGNPFNFAPAAPTQRSKTALSAWPGASAVALNPDPGNDGIGSVEYKVTNPSPGVWHYEYAIYNQNMDRGIRSFAIPIGGGVTLTNVGFHAPPQHPGWTFDGTSGNSGFSSTPWAQTQTASSMTWSTETFAQNPNANAIRWGTLYNFRFDSNRPPAAATATIGFFKVGSPVTISVQAPSGPTATVFVSGRVTNSAGFGVSNSTVTISDTSGNTRTARTNGFGYYRFDEVSTGATYTISVSSKQYTFTPRMMAVNDNITDADFLAAP